MRKKITGSMLLILLCLLISSCATTSKFSSESLNIGMTKEEVIAKFGKPYKSAFSQDKETGVIEETLFYREFLYISGNSNITNILSFKGKTHLSEARTRVGFCYPNNNYKYSSFYYCPDFKLIFVL